jgi:NAD(P)-dependent dehydrogenase (short-subunit alcohol dehydrogenase family)
VGIVAGGGTGIGRATALAMAKAGAVVVIGNRDATKGQEVVALIRQAGGGPCFMVDVWIQRTTDSQLGFMTENAGAQFSALLRPD